MARTVARRRAEPVVAGAARPRDELADPVVRVGLGPRCLRSEAFVDMGVPGQDDFGAVVIERFPGGVGFRVVAVLLVGDGAGLVPVGEGSPGASIPVTRRRPGFAF
jgi:hypothetical protein